MKKERKRGVGVLTSVKIMLLFRIGFCWQHHGVPPTIAELAMVGMHMKGAKPLTNPTVLYHLDDLIDWGYVAYTEVGARRKAWRLTEKARALLNGADVKVTGRGEVR